jgi:hypothetical protein
MASGCASSETGEISPANCSSPRFPIEAEAVRIDLE